MQSLLDILQKTTAFFQQKGVPQARLDAELILAHALGCRRLDLYLQFERLLSDDELAAMRPMVARRGKREPLQYILGEAHFHGLVLRADPRALIPRPETEELIELLASRFAAVPPVSICDLGTGTGAIALSLATVFPQAQVTAVDASSAALELATENARAAGVAERVRFVESDWFGALGGERFSLIVSNPPYLTEQEWEQAEPEVRDWEPQSALTAGPDGLDDYRKIIATAPAHLDAGGWLALETGIAQHAALEELARAAGFAEVESLPDLSKRERFFLARMGC
ncbi:peptide chain release factor N(5)-glutamine methyltransferase [Ruficoccus amylovorans]|uniref:Release factor glutamine methyltransferase n=1 Tax=Ruficoccus amylovorans TaxID=1804625 RepID=A0A842HIU2_9BACT|nr:peptide chain release factor N(5)-glutamine methyltransferase [Ruficoccus amylovorans]MBC2595111.1 peptide chain release factor N(5)-glutamine methyltransferase [Ruficoccus amylovorans]